MPFAWLAPGEGVRRSKGRIMTREERIAALKREAKQRILILDGAMRRCGRSYGPMPRKRS